MSKKDKFVHFRVSNVEKKALEILSALEQRSESETMRLLLREGLSNRDLDVFTMSKQIALEGIKPDILNSLDKIGLCEGNKVGVGEGE